MNGNLIIISSPSGGGKGTLIREVLQAVPAIRYSVSFTTRERRFGEEDGRDYHFISPEQFAERVDAGEFLEHALVHGNWYGTSAVATEKALASGEDLILEIDVQGALQVMARMPNAVVSVFIMPPSFDVLRARLTARNTETPDDLALRLSNAKSEIAEFHKFDYIVINDEVFTASRQLAAIILAERQREVRQIDRIQDIIGSFERSKQMNSGE